MSLKSIAQAPGTAAHVDMDFLRDSVRNYRATFDVGDDEMYVLRNCGHAILDVHPSDLQQVVTEIRAELVEPRTTDFASNAAASLWAITLQYGPYNPLDHSYDGNPIHLPTRWRIDFTVAEVAAFEDVDGNPIVNSAGDPYDPPLVREVTRATLTVLRNEAPSSVNVATLMALSNTINVAAWNGFPPKTARLNPIKIPLTMYSQVNNSFYYPMEYIFDINFDTWVKQVLNQGYRQLDADGNLVPIYINGQPANTPVPLDEEGHAILTPGTKDSSGDVPPDTDPGGEPGEVAGGGEPPSGGTGDIAGATIVIDAYDLIRTSDFSALNMDSLFTLPVIP